MESFLSGGVIFIKDLLYYKPKKVLDLMEGELLISTGARTCWGRFLKPGFPIS